MQRSTDTTLIPNAQPPTWVDNFKRKAPSSNHVSFLTHWHADHYGGLDEKWSVPLYTGPATAGLVVDFLNVQEKHVKPLAFGKPHRVGKNYSVTLIDANHCPGAAMLLFTLDNGEEYLHCGDFRFAPKMKLYPELKPFSEESSKRQLNAIFLTRRTATQSTTCRLKMQRSRLL